jgi:2-C-methyl-D-erythritol 2,4-cyclodiphosphate synthase
MRIGHGMDVHAFGEGDHLILGGVIIAHHQGILAHSDGDVLLHALTDALLGAAALGDIGQHFPDTDDKFMGANSRDLLQAAYAKVQEQGYRLLNGDMTLVAQAPKLSPYIEQMRVNIATDLNVHVQQINVKATTTEQLGAIGRAEGIAAHAVVLIGA